MAPKHSNLGRSTFGPPQKQRRKQNIAILSSFGVAAVKLVGKQATQARQKQHQQLEQEIHDNDSDNEDEPGQAHDWFNDDWNDGPSFDSIAYRKSDKYAQKLASDAAIRESERPQLFAHFVRIRDMTKVFTEHLSTSEILGLQCKVNRMEGAGAEDGGENEEQPSVRCEQRKLKCTVIGFNTRRSLSLSYCMCHPASCQLMYMGLIGSSPRKPSVVFEASYIRYIHHQWRTSPQGMEGFANGLRKYHAEAGMRTRTKLGNDQQTRLHLQAAVDEFRQLETFRTTLISESLQETDQDRLANRCPACFGPRDEQFETSTGKTARDSDIIVNLDGNFSQSRTENAAKYDPLNLNPLIFLHPDRVNEARREVEQSAHIKGVNACSESWKAADGGKKSAIRKSDTGLISCGCRHDIFISLVNIPEGGERLYYGFSIIKWLLQDVDKTAKIGILYDISCNFKAHIEKRNLLPEDQRRLSYATSVFHAYAHSWSCQVEFNPRLIDGFGLSDGEGCERLWSYLAPCIPLNRSASRSHRLANIAERTDEFNKMHQESLCELLSRRWKNAIGRLNNSSAELSAIQGRRPELTDEVLNRHWEDQQAAQGPMTASEQRSVEAEKKSNVMSLFRKRQNKENLSNTMSLLLMKSQLDGTDCSKELTEIFEKFSKEAEELPELEKMLQKELLALDGGEEIEFLCAISDALDSLRRDTRRYRDALLPLQEQRGNRRGANLGAKAAASVTKTLRAKTSPVLTAMRKYNAAVNAYAAYRSSAPASSSLPVVPAHAPATVAALLVLDFHDSFWIDSFFTYRDQVWATDPDVRDGIALLQSKKRGQEEKMRIIWEVRRLVTWAVEYGQKLEKAVKVWKASTSPLDATLIPASFVELDSDLVVSTMDAILERQFDQHRELIRSWMVNFRLQTLVELVISADHDISGSTSIDSARTVASDRYQELLNLFKSSSPSDSPAESEGEEDIRAFGEEDDFDPDSSSEIEVSEDEDEGLDLVMESAEGVEFE